MNSFRANHFVFLPFMEKQHFLDIYKNEKMSKMTFFLAIVFVLTGMISVGSFIQQIGVKMHWFQPTLDLTMLDLGAFAKMLFFHSIPFITGLLSIVFAVHLMLRKSVFSLFGETKDGLKRIGFAFFLFLICYLSFSLIDVLAIHSIEGNSVSSTFFWQVLLIGLFLLIQTAFEEFAFRSFLPQIFVGVGVRKIMAVLLSAIIFGLLHGGNPEISFYGQWILIVYIFQGFFLGILTLFDNSIRLALGYHLANNFLSLVLISSENQVLKVPSLFVVSTENFSIFIMVLQIILTILIFFVVCYRRFGWSFHQLKE